MVLALKKLQRLQLSFGTGGYSNVPNVPGLQEAGFLTSESLFGDKFPKQPYKSLAVLVPDQSVLSLLTYLILLVQR